MDKRTDTFCGLAISNKMTASHLPACQRDEWRQSPNRSGSCGH